MSVRNMPEKGYLFPRRPPFRRYRAGVCDALQLGTNVRVRLQRVYRVWVWGRTPCQIRMCPAVTCLLPCDRNPEPCTPYLGSWGGGPYADSVSRSTRIRWALSTSAISATGNAKLSKILGFGASLSKWRFVYTSSDDRPPLPPRNFRGYRKKPVV